MRVRRSGLARPATTLHVGPTGFNNSSKDGQALHAINRRGHPADNASLRRGATSYPLPGPTPWEREGLWQVAQSSESPGVGTRSKTRKAEAAATQALATRALWPEIPDRSLQITIMTCDLCLQDPPEDRYRETQRTVPAFKIDENQNEVRPPAAGIHSHHRDVFIIPPPHPGGGAAGASTPVSTAPLGLIHHFDPLLATQLREDPDSLAVGNTRLRVLATIRQVRTGLVGQLAALQQWEEAMHSQGGQ